MKRLLTIAILSILASQVHATTIDLPTPGDTSQANTWGTMLITWLNTAVNSYNVKLYGATGDGVTDDTAEINAAITATGASVGYASYTGGGTVYLPPGTYRITDTITMANNVRFVGAGKWNTTIVVDGDCNGITVDPNTQNWSIENLAIRARTSGADIAAAGIEIGRGARFFSLSSVTVAYPSSSSPQFDYGIRIGGDATLGVYIAQFFDVSVYRARQYCLYTTNLGQGRFVNCFFTGREVLAVARVGGSGNGFYGCTFEGYDIGLHLVGGKNVVDGCWFEQDDTTRQNVWCMVVEYIAGGTYPQQRGSENTIVGGSWSNSLTDATCGYVKIIDATGNVFENVKLGHTSGSLVRIEGDSAYHTTFRGGNVPWGQVLDINDPTENFVSYYSDRVQAPAESADRLWAGAAATQWHAGSETTGLKLQTYADATTVTDSNTPGLYTTQSGGVAPFDATGNLIVRPKKIANASVEIWTGATPAQRFKVDETAVTVPGKLKQTAYAPTITDSGDGNPATLTLAPTTSLVELTNPDAHGCTVTLSETGAVSGVSVLIVNVGTNAVAISNTAGVCQLSGGSNITLSGGDALQLTYSSTLSYWYQSAPLCDNN